MTEYINTDIEFSTRANSLINPISPKPGHIYLGETGFEFHAESGRGYIQIPWNSVTNIRAQVFLGGRYVRGFFIETNENQNFEFVVHDAKTALKIMRRHIERDLFQVSESNITKIMNKLRGKA